MEANQGGWRDRVVVNPHICHGKACISGTRIPVSVVVDNIAAGIPAEQILRSYSALTQADLDAALMYAAEVLREETSALPLETGV